MNLFDNDTEDATPIISMWQPWAQWVELEWKQIESRTHTRFASLIGKRIGIHTSQHWDNDWLTKAAAYLTAEQISQTHSFSRRASSVNCTVRVAQHRRLDSDDSPAALIDCATVERHGLVLYDVERFTAVPMKGKQGIWYANLKTIR